MPDLRDLSPAELETKVEILFWIFISWMCIRFSWLLTIGSAVFDVSSSRDLHLFQRSGAILVAAGAFAEIQLSRHPGWFRQEIIDQHLGENAEVWDKFFERSKKYQLYGWGGVIFGTIIWAYGDLFTAMF